MLITKPNTKEKLYLYATWGLFFLACLTGRRDKTAYNFIQDEETELCAYIKKKGYNIHWNIKNQTFEILRG